VAVLGASNYTYAEATWTQNLWDWIRHSGSNGTENSLKESGKLLDCFGRTAEGT
jgi:hypothetical protein